jgi:hypothetical protein
MSDCEMGIVAEMTRQRKLAFTAKIWGNGAVVCRAEEGRPGPVVDQEFGQFETWTHAKAFANRLNDGLDLDPAEVQQIIIDSILCTDELLAAAGSLQFRCEREAKITGKPMRIQFLLAEVDLAAAFCHMLRNKPSPHAKRMVKNARNAIYDAMHYVFRSECSNEDIELIAPRLERLLGLLQELVPLQEYAKSMPAIQELNFEA